MTDTITLTKQQVENEAWADYSTRVGCTILVRTLDGRTEDGDAQSVTLDPPVRCCVVETPEEEVIRWMDADVGGEILDPIWNVEVLEQRADLAGLVEFWVFGYSYVNGVRQPNDDWMDV